MEARRERAGGGKGRGLGRRKQPPPPQPEGSARPRRAWRAKSFLLSPGPGRNSRPARTEPGPVPAPSLSPAAAGLRVWGEGCAVQAALAESGDPPPPRTPQGIHQGPRDPLVPGGSHFSLETSKRSLRPRRGWRVPPGRYLALGRDRPPRPCPAPEGGREREKRQAPVDPGSSRSVF